MELRRGITGFRRDREPPLPWCNLSTFAGHCHAVARELSGRVVRSARPPGVAANFVVGVLEAAGAEVAVLLNFHFPIVAFAVRPEVDQTAPMQFVDDDRLAELFRATGEYQVVGRAELERPVDEQVLAPLASAERDQVKYWRPTRIGDIVFNFWD